MFKIYNNRKTHVSSRKHREQLSVRFDPYEPPTMTNSCAETETTLALKVVRRDLKEENRVRDKIGPSVWVESERTHDFWNDEKEEARHGSKN